jgi:hypothetical protein
MFNFHRPADYSLCAANCSVALANSSHAPDACDTADGLGDFGSGDFGSGDSGNGGSGDGGSGDGGSGSSPAIFTRRRLDVESPLSSPTVRLDHVVIRVVPAPPSSPPPPSPPPPPPPPPSPPPAAAWAVFEFVEFRNNRHTTETQLSEIELYGVDGARVGVTTVLNPGGDSTRKESHVNLVNGVFNDKWVDKSLVETDSNGNELRRSTLQLKLATTVPIKRYDLFTANSVPLGRDPTGWRYGIASSSASGDTPSDDVVWLDERHLAHEDVPVARMTSYTGGSGFLVLRDAPSLPPSAPPFPPPTPPSPPALPSPSYPPSFCRVFESETDASRLCDRVAEEGVVGTTCTVTDLFGDIVSQHRVVSDDAGSGDASSGDAGSGDAGSGDTSSGDTSSGDVASADSTRRQLSVVPLPNVARTMRPVAEVTASLDDDVSSRSAQDEAQRGNRTSLVEIEHRSVVSAPFGSFSSLAAPVTFTVCVVTPTR